MPVDALHLPTGMQVQDHRPCTNTAQPSGGWHALSRSLKHAITSVSVAQCSAALPVGRNSCKSILAAWADAEPSSLQSYRSQQAMPLQRATQAHVLCYTCLDKPESTRPRLHVATHSVALCEQHATGRPCNMQCGNQFKAGSLLMQPQSVTNSTQRL